MTEEEVFAFALAIAHTNGHPDAVHWAEVVKWNWADPTTPERYAAADAPE